ncbi:MAG TPA: ATP-binding protein [Vicinamibacterales bacterium]|nr:ATP-binding protein [Vicinamibacterales bacterium]
MRDTDAHLTPGQTPARYSLRWRLPFAMAASTGLVIAAVVAVGYREVKANLIQAAGIRAQATADQLAGLFVQMTQQRMNELQRMANHPSLRQLFEHPDNDTRDVARAHLAQIRSPGPQIMEVWNAAGECVLSVATPPGAENALPPGSMPAGTGVAPLQRHGDHVVGESVAEIAADAGERDGVRTARARLGFLVVRRPLNGAPTAELLNRLVGQGAVISLGNKAGDVWTDLVKAIAPPPIDRSHPGVVQYAGPNGGSVGALTDIRGTPWSMWVEFPQALILAPARAFLERMSLIALGFVVLSAIGIRMIAARITTPLQELTLASEAVASGDYARRVGIRRRDELGRLSVAFNAMTQEVEGAHRDLEERIRQRTAKLEEAGVLLKQRLEELDAANRELESFSYSVSHDLRAPLRHITGFAMMLRESATSTLDGEGQRFLTTIVDAATRMGRLIDDLLAFSRVGRTQLARSPVDLNRLIQEAKQEVCADINGRAVSWQVQDLPTVKADPALLRLVFVNLLSNALKYSAKRPQTEIEVGVMPERDDTVVFVRDNGVGFDMQYAHKLFGVFQRLHSNDEFEGTGIGLANVRRIVQRHGGRTWAEGAINRGATFYVSLPNESAVDSL